MTIKGDTTKSVDHIDAQESLPQQSIVDNSPNITNDSSELNKDQMCWKKILPPMDSSELIVFGVAMCIFVAVTVLISIVFFTWKQPSSDDSTALSTSGGYVYNQCTQQMQSLTPLLFLANQDMFDYRQYSFIYQPSVISAKITFAFGFQHQSDFWGLDDIVVTDTYTNSETPLNSDGTFESNNLTMSYTSCSLTNGQGTLAQILWDFPHLGDCYYSDGSQVSMVYLMQSFPIVGGRNYNVSFWLQNNGDQPNIAVVLIDSS